MTYDDVTKALAAAGFFTYYRRESDTLICSAAEWPNVPQMANSFWLAERRSGWYIATWTPRLYCSTAEWPNVPQMASSFWLDEQRSDWSIATWAPHLYRFADEASVPNACIAWLRQHPEPAQWDFDGGLKAEFALSEVDSNDLPGK
jgi:hypothetical protein